VPRSNDRSTHSVPHMNSTVHGVNILLNFKRLHLAALLRRRDQRQAAGSGAFIPMHAFLLKIIDGRSYG
jgi:hypothetical protein